MHLLVARAFIPNPDNKPQVNHIDGNKKNNDISNLEWATAKENVIHAYRTGLHDNVAIGEQHGLNVYSTEQVKKVCQALEKNEMTLSEISNSYKVNKSLIYDIRSKKYWRHISKDYNIDNYSVSEYNHLSDEQKQEMVLLIRKGYRQCDVLRYFDLETNKRNYALIKTTYMKIKNNMILI